MILHGFYSPNMIHGNLEYPGLNFVWLSKINVLQGTKRSRISEISALKYSERVKVC
jgi:hypothetical protein